MDGKNRGKPKETEENSKERRKNLKCPHYTGKSHIHYLTYLVWEILEKQGPRYSSFGYGAMQELGAFKVKSDDKTLYRNKHAWHNGWLQRGYEVYLCWIDYRLICHLSPVMMSHSSSHFQHIILSQIDSDLYRILVYVITCNQHFIHSHHCIHILVHNHHHMLHYLSHSYQMLQVIRVSQLLAGEVKARLKALNFGDNTDAPGEYRENCFRTVGEMWKNWKSYIKHHYYDEHEMEDLVYRHPLHVKADQWEVLVRYWGREDVQAQSPRNK